MSRESRIFKKIDHVEIVPSDFEKFLAFYRDVLSFTAGERHEINMAPLREIIRHKVTDTQLAIPWTESPMAPFNSHVES